jgi:PhoPQ-activated pathogenicity-related protein
MFHACDTLQLSDVIVRTTGDFYWGADASTLYYTTQVCTLCTCSSYYYYCAHTITECIAYSVPTHSQCL